HPLRNSLGIDSMAIYSPRKEVLLRSMGLSQKYSSIIEDIPGGFEFSQLLMMVHETYHLKAGSDLANVSKKNSSKEPDFKVVTDALQKDHELQSLVMAYTRLIFTLSADLESASLSDREQTGLSELKTLIN